MMLLQNTIVEILTSGGGLRINAAGWMPTTLVSFAAAARRGNARLEIVVGDTLLMPATMAEIGAAGAGAVLFDVR